MTTVKIEHEPCVVCHTASNRTDWLHHGLDKLGKAWHACDHHTVGAIHDALVHTGRINRGGDINHGVPGQPSGVFSHKLAPVISLPRGTTVAPSKSVNSSAANKATPLSQTKATSADDLGKSAADDVEKPKTKQEQAQPSATHPQPPSAQTTTPKPIDYSKPGQPKTTSAVASPSVKGAGK